MDLWRVQLRQSSSGGYFAEIFKAGDLVHTTNPAAQLATVAAAGFAWIEAEFRRLAAKVLRRYRSHGYLSSLVLAELPDRMRERVFRRVRHRYPSGFPQLYFDRINNAQAPAGYFSNDPAAPPDKKKGGVIDAPPGCRAKIRPSEEGFASHSPTAAVS